MKRILYMLAAAVLVAGLSACSGKNDTGVDISGQWHLVETGDLIGEQGLDRSESRDWISMSMLRSHPGLSSCTRRSGQVWAGTGIMKGHTLSPETMS